MDTRAKLDLLNQAADVEVAAAFEAPAERGRRDLYPCLTHVSAPGGRRVPILKVLQTNACRNDCRYCAFRAGRDVRRERLTPDELAASVDLMHRAGLVEGIFLSSGVVDTIRSMDDMLATADLLRGKYAFHGYLHLKLLPGSEPAQVARAVELADRVSTNLEAPGPERLALLAPQKAMADLVSPLAAAAQAIRARQAAQAAQGGEGGPRFPGRPSGYGGGARLGLSTQFVVGPAGESDRELLGTAAWLYREIRLARAYYSAFQPIPDTPLADAAPTGERRQHRLYQADWLLRYYHFGVEELPFDGDGRLSVQTDPKAAWARQHPERFPVEVNRAPVEELLRVPGIGPVSAQAIVRARRQASLRTLGDLRRLGARADQAAPYVLLAGRRPISLAAERRGAWQLPLDLTG
ncbi:MAG TPA: radical SAM protein [Anaerolineae bacterium]